MNAPFLKHPKGHPSKLEDSTELSEKSQKNRKKKDSKTDNHSELSDEDVLSGEEHFKLLIVRSFLLYNKPTKKEDHYAYLLGGKLM
eukprot:10053724-Ditylum_brightwellii.AAC.1